MKGVRPDCSNVSEAVGRLRREYSLLTTLGMSGVAQPVMLEQVEGRPVLVLEDAGPRSLEHWLERRALPPERFLPLARGWPRRWRGCTPAGSSTATSGPATS